MRYVVISTMKNNLKKAGEKVVDCTENGLHLYGVYFPPRKDGYSYLDFRLAANEDTTPVWAVPSAEPGRPRQRKKRRSAACCSAWRRRNHQARISIPARAGRKTIFLNKEEEPNMKKRTSKLLSLLLTLVMVLGMLPTMSITAFAEDKTPITEFSGSISLPAPVYGKNIRDNLPTVITSDPVRFFNPSWQKKKYSDVDAWNYVNSGVFTEGTWRYIMKVSEDDNYVLTDPLTVTINGVPWKVVHDYQNNMFHIISPEFTVTAPTGGPLQFVAETNAAISDHQIGETVNKDLTQYTAGGTPPYVYSKVSGPEWLSVSADGKITGTANEIQGSSTLKVKVTDAKGESVTAAIPVGCVTLKDGDRIPITEISGNISLPDPVYGKNVRDNRPTVYTSDRVSFWNHSWQKKKYSDVDAWNYVNSGVFTEGTWRYIMKVSEDDNYVLTDPLTVTINGVSWKVVHDYQNNMFHIISPEFTVTAPPTLEGTATLSSAYYNSPVNPNTTGLPSTGLSYKWQRSNGGTSSWANISGATKRSYTPGEDDVYIRLVITAYGYEGSVISNAVEVKQALINFEKPVMPTLSYDSTNGLVVTNAKENQEYLVTYSNTEPSDWSSAVKPSADGNLALSASQNTTVYVHTRVAETTYKPAGMYTDYNSIYTGTPTYLVDFAVNYSKLSLKVGDVVKLTATPIPAGATAWQTTPGVKWYSNDASAKLYKDEACTQSYDRDTDGFAESVFIKGISQNNWLTVGAERTISGYTPTVRQITVAVTDTEGNYALERLAFPDVTLAPGESVTVDIASYPDPSKVEGEMTFEPYAANPASTLTLTPSDNNTKLTIKVPETAELGGYKYNVNLDGTKITTNAWTVTVAKKDIPVDGVTVIPSNVTLAPGESVDLTAIVSPSNATNPGTVTWESNNENVTVDTDGTVTVLASAAGGETATITATCGGKSGTSTVQVVVPKYSVTVTNGDAFDKDNNVISAPIKAGAIVQLMPSYTFDDMVFSKWTVTSGDVEISDLTDPFASFAMPAEDVEIQARFEAAPIVDITAANVTVTAPVKGGTPANATTADTQYTVTSTLWLPVDDPFEPSTVYNVMVALKVNEGNQFTSDTAFKINGENATVLTQSAGYAQISYIFPATASSGSSSGGSSGGGVSTYAITVDSAKNGDVTSSHKSAAKGTTITLTVEPDKGYTLETITATDASGNKLKLTEKDGKYTFTMPASKVTVKATFMEDNSMLNFFVDVPADAYYYDAVLWAAEEGITGGVDATHFAPNATCTRAQAVTFLWRAAGSPAPKSSNMPFTDVAAGSYYEQAVLWAVENGITKGTSDTAFSPNATCSRAQIVTFLWRSQKSPASDSVNPFTDVAADAYYNTAVLWAVENGITAGTTATTFSPNNDCTRAQIVTFLFRCLGK